MSLYQIAQDLYSIISDSSSAGGFVSGEGKEELLCEFKDHTKWCAKSQRRYLSNA